ncbi:MAG: phosphoglucomutase/phosphomannomutase family protein [Bacteroidia bacterium]
MIKIKFGTDGWRAIIAKEYTFDNLARVTQATIAWLKASYTNPSIMLGYDCRFNGKLFAEHAANIFAQNGIKVFLSPNFVSTPMISLATFKRQASAGIILTASHNPAEYSGYKIKGHYGGPAFPSMITAVEDQILDEVPVYEDKFSALVESKMIEYYDMEALYINHIKESFDLKLIRESGIKIGYDAMYGAGQNVIRKILPDAVRLHCDFNPSFKGTAPEPIEKNLHVFEDLIKQEKIQVGLATDGDADRIGLYDENANFVDSHHILLLLIHYMVNHKGLKGKVVSTFSCTKKIQRLCEHYGLENEVTKIGFKYICEIMLNENVIVGGEESGGIAIAGHVPERDGIFIGLTIMELMAKSGKSLTQLVQEIYDLVGSFYFGRNDLRLTEEKKQSVIAACKEGKFQQFGAYTAEKMEDLDGYKYHFAGDAWIMVRPSGTEPVLRVYCEASSKELVNEMLTAAVATLLA